MPELFTGGALQKSSPQIFAKLRDGETPVPECLSNNVAGIQGVIFIKKDSSTRVFQQILGIFKKTFSTGHLWMNASCVCLRILRSFSEHLFHRKQLGDCLFHVQVAGI